jgi:hypothetical protein
MFSLTANAQKDHQKNDKRDQLQNEKLQFIEKNLQLTPEEKNNFMPVYAEFDKKREDLHRKRHQIFKNYQTDGLNMSNDEILKTADQLVDIDVQTADLEKQYLEKFKKTLPPVKILLLYKTELEFKKDLLRKMKAGKDDHPIEE